MTKKPESLDDLLCRFGGPATVPRVSLTETLAAGGDSLDIIAYLAFLGCPVFTLDDLLRINGDQDEEEVRAFRVREGVAVAIVSQGEWLLFTL